MKKNNQKRRDFIKRSSDVLKMGLISSFIIPNISSAKERKKIKYNFDKIFPRYTKFNPLVPVWCVTPRLDRVIHRFHSSSPFSPSGRYLGLTRLGFDERRPKPGEKAEVVVVDLLTGKTDIVAETRGWDTQLGAQVQWGANDTELFFNDVDTNTWMPYSIKMDPLTGKKKKLDFPVYIVSPDGKWAASTCLRRIGNTQAGYGVLVPSDTIPENHGLVDNDGVYITDTQTGKTKMIASYKQIVEKAVPVIDMSRYGPGDFYGFHVKWNSKSDRIMLVLRYKPKNGKYKPQLLTMKADGTDVRVAIPASEWADKGGNHPIWCPDGEHVMMNLKVDNKDMYFMQARYDGTGLRKITEVKANRGHPSLHPSGKFILTDAYAVEDVAFGDGTAPLWLIDLEKKEKKTLVRIDAVVSHFREINKLKAKEMRVDLHPAWDSRTYTFVAFNGVQDGTRRVFVADLSGLVPSL